MFVIKKHVMNHLLAIIAKRLIALDQIAAISVVNFNKCIVISLNMLTYNFYSFLLMGTFYLIIRVRVFINRTVVSSVTIIT